MKGLLGREQLPLLGRLGLVGVANLAAFGLTVAVGVWTARVLVPSEYGALAYFFALVGWCRLLAALGLSSRIATDAATLSVTGDRLELGRRFYTLLGLRIASVCLVLALAATGSWLSGDWLILAAASAGGALLLADFGASLLQGLQRIAQVAVFACLQPAAYGAALLLLGGRGEGWTLPEAIGAYTATCVATAGAALWLGIRDRGLPRPSFGLLSRRRITMALTFSAQLYAISILLSVHGSLQTFLLGTSGRFEEAAYFSVANALAGLPVTLVAAALGAVFFPRLCALRAAGDAAGARELVERLAGWVWVGSAWVGWTLFFAGGAALRTVYGEAYVGASDVLAALAVATPFAALTSIYTFALVAAGRPGRAVAGVGLQVAVLLAVVVPTLIGVPGMRGVFLSAVGAALAAMVGLAALARWAYVLYGWGISRTHLLLGGLGGLVAVWIGQRFPWAGMAPLLGLAGQVAISGVVLGGAVLAATVARARDGAKSPRGAAATALQE